MPSAPVSLILVRNAVTYDARVLREAHTLTELGFDVVVAGVVSTAAPETESEVEGIAVRRLAPGRALRRATGVGRLDSDAAAPAGGLPAGRRPRQSASSRLRRLALTAMYYQEGIGLVIRSRPLLVHANDYNTMWIGVAAKLLCRSRLVYDCHELWADRNGRPEWRPWLVACEALFVRIADATITASPGYAQEISRRYRIPAPIVVRNIPAARPHGPGAQRNRDRPIAVYVGGVMPGRGLEPAIRALAHAPEFGLRLIGPGRDGYRAHLRQTAQQAGVADRLELEPAVAPSAVVETIDDAVLGLMLIEPVCRSYELTVPNKLFEYAAAGLPILSSDLPVAGSIVEQERLGAVVSSDDPELIAQGMRRLAEPDTNRRIRAQVDSFARRVTWEQEKTLLEGVYRNLVTEPAPAGADAERERVADRYRRYAASGAKQRAWSAENPGNVAIRDELAAAVFELAGAELQAAEAILDIGCGSGWWLERLAGDGRVTASLDGLELLPDRAASARNRVTNAAIAVGDARSLPYDSGRFDVVTLFTVLSSMATLPDAQQVVHEARRTLRPGGVLLVWEPRIFNPLNAATIRIPAAVLSRSLPDGRVRSRLTTVAPPVARRLGRGTGLLYPLLASVQPLLTHRLVCAREP